MPRLANVQKNQTVGVRLSDGEARAVRDAAAAVDQTVSEWVRGLIREALAKIKPRKERK